MNHPPQSSSATVRRALYLFALASLFIAVLASGGCNKQNGNGNNTQGNTKPNPPPNKTITAGSDDPVVITGGSTDLDFDHRTFKPDGTVGGRAKYSNMPIPVPSPSPLPDDAINLKLKALRIYDDQENSDDTPIGTYDLLGGKVVITLRCKVGNETRLVTIQDDPTPSIVNKVNILFPTKTPSDLLSFKERFNSPYNRRHFSRKLKIQPITADPNTSGVVVTKDGNPVTCQPATGGQCALPNKFTLEIAVQQNP